MKLSNNKAIAQNTLSFSSPKPIRLRQFLEIDIDPEFSHTHVSPCRRLDESCFLFFLFWSGSWGFLKLKNISFLKLNNRLTGKKHAHTYRPSAGRLGLIEHVWGGKKTGPHLPKTTLTKFTGFSLWTSLYILYTKYTIYDMLDLVPVENEFFWEKKSSITHTQLMFFFFVFRNYVWLMRNNRTAAWRGNRGGLAASRTIQTPTTSALFFSVSKNPRTWPA